MSQLQHTSFDPSRTHPAWRVFAESWQMNRDFAEMHNHVLRSGRYLDRFGEGTAAAESPSQYAWRRGAALAVDCCGELVDLRVGNLFRTLPVRTYQDSPWAATISRYLSDVDGGGTSMDDFMRRVLRMHYVNGVDIVVDKTPLPPGAQVTSRAQEQQLGARPYLTAFDPLSRIDWSCNHAGKYLWVRYQLGQGPAVDETASPGPRRYLTLTRDCWRLYHVQPQAEGEPTACMSGPMSLGIVPAVPFYYRTSSHPEYGPIPLSLLTRISPVARALLNLLSQGQLDIYMAIGILAATGVDPEQLPREVAPMCWLGLPEGAAVQHITPAVEHIREKRAWASMLQEAILRMGKLLGASARLTGRASSGLQVEAERTDLDNEMSATAGQLEQVERDVVRLMISRKEGRLVDHDEIGFCVEYNRKFVLSGVSDLIDQARSLLSVPARAQIPELSRLFLQRVLDAVANRDHPRYEQIRRAIESADLTTGSRAEQEG